MTQTKYLLSMLCYAMIPYALCYVYGMFYMFYFLSGVGGVNNDQTKSEAGWAAGMTVPGIVSDLTSRSQGCPGAIDCKYCQTQAARGSAWVIVSVICRCRCYFVSTGGRVHRKMIFPMPIGVVLVLQ